MTYIDDLDRIIKAENTIIESEKALNESKKSKFYELGMLSVAGAIVGACFFISNKVPDTNAYETAALFTFALSSLVPLFKVMDYMIKDALIKGTMNARIERSYREMNSSFKYLDPGCKKFLLKDFDNLSSKIQTMRTKLFERNNSDINKFKNLE